MKSNHLRIGIVALLVLMVSCSGKEEGVNTVGKSQSETSADTERANSTPKSMAELMRDVEERHAKSPQDRVDPAAVVDPSRDPGKLLSWIQENTRLVPYEGSLRGPLGVLMDRSGNSLDRALLLARLFDLAGFEARVIGEKLPPGEAAKILAAGTGASAPPASPQSEHDRTQIEFRKQAKATAEMIMGNVGQLAAVMQAPEATHYWVQYKDGNQWVDADPSLESTGKARQGGGIKPLAVDPTTHGVRRPAEAGGGDDLMHSVTMRLVVERWEAGKLVEDLLALVPFDSTAGPLAATTLTFMPIDRSTGQAVQRKFASGAELSETLLDETAWAVIFGDDHGRGRIGRMFDDAGVVGNIPRFNSAARIARAGGQAFGAMTGSLSGPDEAEDEVDDATTVLTALIADYEFESPGKPSRQVRRFIFDSIGPEARRASGSPLQRPKWTDQQVIERGADLAAVNDTLVAFASLPWDTYVYRYGQRVIGAKDAILAVAAGSKDEATRRRVSYGLGFRTLEMFAATRDSTLDPALAIVEPQIYRRIVRFMPTVDASTFDVQVFGDLAWNRLAPATGRSSAAAVIAQGVLDTLQEREIVLADGSPQPGQATAALFDEAKKQGIGITAVRNANDGHLADYPGPARARMLGDIDAGQIVVAPLRPVDVASRARVGWWRVDPDSGQTVGAMDNGLLVATGEYSVTKEAQDAQISGATTEERARAWAQHVADMRHGRVSDTQFENFVKMATKSIEETGLVPII